MPRIDIQGIDRQITPEALLKQRGWFLLRDVFAVLDAESTGKYKLAFKQIQRIREQSGNPFEVMGHSKYGGRVVVWMERFAPWYRENPILQTKKLDGDMSFVEFLRADGYYKLSEVCKYYKDHLPYSYLVLKRGADRREDPLHEMGIVKSDTTYLVSMPYFEAWLRGELIN